MFDCQFVELAPVASNIHTPCPAIVKGSRNAYSVVIAKNQFLVRVYLWSETSHFVLCDVIITTPMIGATPVNIMNSNGNVSVYAIGRTAV